MERRTACCCVQKVFAAVEQQRQFVYFAHRGMNCVFSLISCSNLWLVTPAASCFAPRSSEGGFGWKRGGLAPPNPPADFRCGPAGLRVPTSPRGCVLRQVPGAIGRCPGHRQVPGGHRQVPGARIGTCHIYQLFGAKRLGTRAAALVTNRPDRYRKASGGHSKGPPILAKKS